MKTLRCIVVDDEPASRLLLASMLQTYCPEALLAGTAHSVQSGYELILAEQPDIVLLDVKMREQSGFELLRMFPHIDFFVVFVTGFDNYALQAFEHDALDYLLKPVDHEKLIAALAKAARIQKQYQGERIIQFIHTMDQPRELRLKFHHHDRVEMIPVSEIVAIRAARSYTEVSVTGGRQFVCSKSLREYARELESYSQFIRINKSMIISTLHIVSYSKGSPCFISLKNVPDCIEISRRKKAEIMQRLKEL